MRLSLLIVLVLAVPSPATAKGGKRRAPVKPAPVVAPAAPAAPAGLSPVDVAGLRKDLASNDVARAVDAAHRLADDTTAPSLDAMLDELAVGAPPAVADVLVAGVAARKDARALDALAVYARNRNPGLRKKAVVGIAALADARTTGLLVAALSDASPDVRAVAAHALGDRRERSAAPALVKLLGRGDPTAGEALVAVAGPEVAAAAPALVGVAPSGLLASTLGAILNRADFGPDPARVTLVEALVKLPGVTTTQALNDYVAATKADPERPSRAAAQKAIEGRQ